MKISIYYLKNDFILYNLNLNYFLLKNDFNRFKIEF